VTPESNDVVSRKAHFVDETVREQVACELTASDQEEVSVEFVLQPGDTVRCVAWFGGETS
jgi:hypothetical protein